jgi:hypothetical protein
MINLRARRESSYFQKLKERKKQNEQNGINKINKKKLFDNKNYIKKKFSLNSFKKKRDCSHNLYYLNGNIIKLDLSIPMYFGDSLVKKKLAILFLKYLRKLSNDLTKNNIKLTFTIIGSDQEESLNMFHKYLKNSEEDIYVEFNQNNIDYSSVPEKYHHYRNPLFKMLHVKFITCFQESWKKDRDIYLISGSNDFIHIDFYRNMVHELNIKKKQIFGLNKVKNISLITKNENIVKLEKDRTLIWDLDYGKYVYDDYNNILTGCIFGITKTSLLGEREHMFKNLQESHQAFNELMWERIFAKNGCEIGNIECNICINYKVNTDLTSIDMIKNTIRDLYEFNEEEDKYIMEECENFWNNIISL